MEAVIDWDRETYSYLCQLDNRADTDSWHMSEDTEKMETHFISLLSYLRDHPEIVKILNGYQEIPYDMMIESVKQDGLRIYGFSIVCQKEKLLQSCGMKRDFLSVCGTVGLNKVLGQGKRSNLLFIGAQFLYFSDRQTREIGDFV